MLRCRPSRVLGASLAVTVALTAGCSSSGGGGSSTSPTSGSTPSGSSSLSGTAATGSPVTIGFINGDSSPLGDYSDLTTTAKGLVEYLNDKLGGLGGHRVTLQTCATNGADNSSAGCAAKLIAAKPVAIITGLDTGANGSVPLITKAGIPYIGTTPITSAELGTPGAYALSGGIGGSFGAADLYLAKTLKVKNVGVLTNDSATAKSVANGLAIGLLKSLGSGGKVVTHSLTETDLSAAWASASSGADAAMAIEPSAQCVSAMRARAAAGSTIPIVLFGCSDTNTIKSAGSAADGALFASGFESPDANTADAVQYRAVMQQYAPSAQRDSYTESILSAYVLLSRILAKTTTVTAASTKAAIAASVNVPGFLTPPITCNGKQVPMLPAFCSGGGYVLKQDGGKLVDIGGGAKNVFVAK